MRPTFTRPLTALLLVPIGILGAQDTASKVPAPAGSLLEPAQLNRWIQAGYRTEKGERVIILDALPGQEDQATLFAGQADALRAPLIKQFGEDSIQVRMIAGLDKKGLLGHIQGAQMNASHTGLEVMARTDGPAKIEHQVGNGPAIERLLRGHGITAQDVIVITSSQQTPPVLCAPRLWWTLNYWGFPAEKIKLLNGGNKAWALAGLPLKRGLEEPSVTPSTFSLSELPARHFEARVSLEDMLQMVDSGQTVNGGVLLFDVRQPPVAFFLKDAQKADGTLGKDGIPDLFQVRGFQYHAEGKYFTREGEATRFTMSDMLFSPKTVAPGSPVRAPFNGATNPPVAETNPFLIHGHVTTAAGTEAPLALPLSQKPTAFEGIIRGAHLVKTGAYDITLPSLLGPDNRFKSADELKALFAKAGITGTKPVVLYCNTGALSAVYFYALQEICGFRNVRMYDGSWMEWGALAAFEPTDGTFVRRDPVLTYPAAPALQPAFWIFSGENTYLEWDGKQFVSPGFTPVEVKQHLKPFDLLQGQLRWDTLHRSEHVVFRPSASTNRPDHFQTYNPKTDWPKTDLHAFEGQANRIQVEDKAYTK